MISLRAAALRRPLTQQFSRSARTTLRTAERQPWQRPIGRRGYAEAHGAHKKEGSDLPWALGATIITGGGLIWLQPWSSPSSHGGDHGDHDSHGDAHEEKEEPAEEEPPAEEKSEDKPEEGEKGEDKPEEKSDEKSDDAPKEEEKSEGKPEGEGKKDDKKDDSSDDSSDKPDGGDGGDGGDGAKESSKEPKKEDAKDGPSDLKGDKKKEPSGKSDTGEKKRVDSSQRAPQGAAADESAINNSAQKGLSNAPTMHSTDQMSNPEQSKKPEGAPDSAKLPAPIKPGR